MLKFFPASRRKLLLDPAAHGRGPRTGRGATDTGYWPLYPPGALPSSTRSAALASMADPGPRSAALVRTATREGTSKHHSEAAAQHRSHQGSGPSPEISHRNPVYPCYSQQEPESWSPSGWGTTPTISPGSIMNITRSTP